MNDFQKTLTTAAQIVFNNPLLWFFGLFLAAGFNFNWLYLFHTGNTARGIDYAIYLWQIIQHRPIHALLPIVSLLIVAVLGWLLVNWIKIGFLLNTVLLLDKTLLGEAGLQLVKSDATIWKRQKELFRYGLASLFPVLAMSLFTIAAQTIVTTVIFGPQFLWARHSTTQTPGMLVLAGALFVIFMLFFSLLNFFTACFSVIYGKSFNNALAFAIHLLTAKIKSVAIFSILLLLLYIAGIALGLQINIALHWLLYRGESLIMISGWSINILPYANAISFIFLLWLGFLNALFNTALLLFFINNCKPLKVSPVEKSPSLVPFPAIEA